MASSKEKEDGERWIEVSPALLEKSKTWKDYPRKQDKLAIVGFAPTTRHLAPFDDPEFEVWGLNEEYHFDWMKRFDRWFQIHPRWDVMRGNNMNHRNHVNWLMNTSATCVRCAGERGWEIEKKDEAGNATKEFSPCPECNATGVYNPPEYRSTLPVYMQDAWDDIPNSIKYPLDEAKALLPKTLWQDDYFTSSAALMLSLAYLMGYKEVWFYGFEMGTTTEYHYQRANFEYLSGYFTGLGMAVYVPKESTLFRGELYGFKNMKTGFRQNLEMRKSILELQEQKAKQKVDIHTGKVQAFQVLMMETNATPVIQAKLEEAMREYQIIIGTHNVIKGAQAETENLMKLYDNYFLGGSEEGSVEDAEKVKTFVNLEYQSG